MAVARVSSRGQVTIPPYIRKQLNVAQGDDLLIDIDPNTKTASLRVVKRRRLSEFYGVMHVTKGWEGKAKEMEAVGKYLATHGRRRGLQRRRLPRRLPGAFTLLDKPILCERHFDSAPILKFKIPFFALKLK